MTLDLDELERKAKAVLADGGPWAHPATVLALIERVRDLETTAIKASAELRHAYRAPTIDRGLVERAVKYLEGVTTPKDET